MKVTVLVCTRNRSDSIESCILRILNNTYRDFEFLIVDQSTSKKTEEIVKKHISADKRIKYLRMEGQGKSRALNLGIRNSSGYIIATTDDDCIVNKDWIENIIKAFEKNPDVDIVYGRVINKPDEFSMKDRKYSGRFSKLFFVGDGANVSSKRSIFKKLKGYDELLGPGAPLGTLGDQDFAYRALYLGLKILNAKQVTVTHVPLSYTNAQEVISRLRPQEIGKGALLFKSIRCFELPAVLICLISHTQRLIDIARHIMLNKGRRQVNKPRILLILQAWVLITYWDLLGMIMSMKYPIDKTHNLFIPRE